MDILTSPPSIRRSLVSGGTWSEGGLVWFGSVLKANSVLQISWKVCGWICLPPYQPPICNLLSWWKNTHLPCHYLWVCFYFFDLWGFNVICWVFFLVILCEILSLLQSKSSNQHPAKTPLDPSSFTPTNHGYSLDTKMDQ